MMSTTARPRAPKASAVRCAACGHAHSAATWSTMATLVTLRGAELDRYVVGWPRAAVVEVRACRGCGRGVARTSRGADDASE